jgi:hypothetical protein
MPRTRAPATMAGMTNRPRSRLPAGPLAWFLAAIGIGALVAGARTLLVVLALTAVALAPLTVWLAWNVLDFAAAIGAPELGFWGVLLLTLFLLGGFGLRLAIALVVALVDPAWLHGSARLHWPDPSVRVFVALALLLAVASFPGRGSDRGAQRARRSEARSGA